MSLTMNGSNDVKTSTLRLLILAPAQPVGKADQPQLASIRASYDPSSLFPLFLKALTGTEPSKDMISFAGYTSHPPLFIKNKYYSANIGIWCDELPALTSTTEDATGTDFAEWTKNMQSTEAKEVREVIGGLVIILPHSTPQQLTKQDNPSKIEEYAKYLAGMNELRESIENEFGRDVASIAVVQDMTPSAAAERYVRNEATSALNSFVQKLEDSCMTEYDIFGWDIVPWQSSHQATNNDVERSDSVLELTEKTTQTNEYGEKLGMARVLEILEQTDWTIPTDALDDDDDDYGLASTHDPFGLDQALGNAEYGPGFGSLISGPENTMLGQSEEFQREIMGLHFALREQNQKGAEEDDDSGDELQVDQLLTLMDRATEIRAASAEMSKNDREKFARREVIKLMKDIKLG